MVGHPTLEPTTRNGIQWSAKKMVNILENTWHVTYATFFKFVIKISSQWCQVNNFWNNFFMELWNFLGNMNWINKGVNMTQWIFLVVRNLNGNFSRTQWPPWTLQIVYEISATLVLNRKHSLIVLKVCQQFFELSK